MATAADCAAAIYVGRHAIGDLSNIECEFLKNSDRIMQLFRIELACEGFRILEEHLVLFPGPQSGATGVFILSESHASFHTYPELGYLAVDVFSCGLPDPENVVRGLALKLGGTVRLQAVIRRAD
jgi:S-adenosylmethionine decarboxylase